VGMLLDSGLHRLRISIDGSSQETYAAYRQGGDLGKVLEASRMLVHERQKRRTHKPLIIWQFIVFRHNEHELEDMRRKARLFGVDALDVKTAWLSDPVKSDLLPSQLQWRRKPAINGTPAPCWRSWHSIVVTAKGEVLPCCYDKDKEYCMGNLAMTGLDDIWNSEAYHSFRKRQMRKEASALCKGCSA